MGHYPDAREGGIVDEVWTAIRRKCVGGNLNDYAESSLAILDLCLREKNLQLLLNTHIDQVHVNKGHISHLSGSQSSTGARFDIHASQYVDSTGDAHVAYLAGCRYMTGQESRAQFNESLAPEKPQALTMGNTLLFQSEKLDAPVEFKRPPWAPDLAKIDCYWTLHPPAAPLEYGSWVFEYGGKKDTIAEAEEIHLELLKIIYAAWDYLKKRFPDDLANHRLSFISSLPGKRESRRIVGDYILTQDDVVNTKRFPDDVAYAGWSLDLHNPDGFYGKERPTTFYFFPEIHSIPLRSLYAADIDNLWLAGRDISVSHIALGGARLMASCGMQGESVGIAASFAHRNANSCRDTTKLYIKDIQQDILKAGSYLPNVVNEDSGDLARHASKIWATSEASLDTGDIESWDPIGPGIGIALPIVSGRLQSFTLQVDNPTLKAIKLRACLQPIRFRRDFHDTHSIAEAQIEIPPGQSTATFPLAATLEPDLWKVQMFSETAELKIGQCTRRISGTHVADYYPDGYEDGFARQVGMPNPALWMRRFNPSRLDHTESFHPTPCFSTRPVQAPYGASNTINGINRTERLPNLWISEQTKALPQSLYLAWDEAQTIQEIRIIFDSDMDIAMPPVQEASTLVSDYDLIGRMGRQEACLASVSNNQQRLCIHRFEPQLLDEIEIRIRRCWNDGRQARVFEIRCY